MAIIDLANHPYANTYIGEVLGQATNPQEQFQPIPLSVEERHIPYRESSNKLTLPTKQAAKYVGCKNSAQFRREVRRGMWPKPYIESSRPHRWSVAELNASLHKNSINSGLGCEADIIDKLLGIT